MMRRRNFRGPIAMIMAACLFTASAGSARSVAVDGIDMEAESRRIVSQYKAVTTSPPGKVPARLHVDGPILGNGDMGTVISGPPQAQRFWLAKNSFWKLRDDHRQGGPRGIGGLEVNIPALNGASYHIEQDIFPAITTSTFTNNESAVTMRSFIPATESMLIIELSVSGKAVDVDTRMWVEQGRASREALGREDGILWATKAFSVAVRHPTAAAAALTVMGGKVSHPELTPVEGDDAMIPDWPAGKYGGRMTALPAPKTQPGPKFSLQPGETVTLAIAVQTQSDAKDPLASAIKMAKGLNAKSLAELETQHSAWWSDFWAKSFIEIGDPVLEEAFYMANYMMGSGTRDMEFPAGLFSLWSTHDDPSWAGDYHLNFDFQSQYYGLYKCNHIEQADTFDQPILDYMERGRAYAKNIFGIRGLYYPVGIGPKGTEPSRQLGRLGAPIEQGGVFMGQKCNAPYCLVNMAMRWYHTYDLDYAKKVYPFVLGVTDFWEDYLRFEPFTPGNDKPIAENYDPPTTTNLPPIAVIDGVPVNQIPVDKLPPGRYVSYNDSIQEHCSPDVNALLSLGLAYNTFSLALDMSKEMGVDADRRAKWQHIFDNLSTLPTFEKDGKTLFRYSERGSEWIQGNSVGLQHIYPSGAIGLDDDPKLLEIGRNTIHAEGRKWKNDNGENSHYPAAVRVGCDPDLLLEKLKDLWLTARKSRNGFPESMEQCSTTPTTLTEMICMSHRQVLRLFPVWPKDKDARFSKLRAEGAFLVSSELKDGEVQFVEIHSEKGRDCTIVNPWPGKKVIVYRDGKKIDSYKGERFVMKTKAGETVELRKGSWF